MVSVLDVGTIRIRSQYGNAREKNLAVYECDSPQFLLIIISFDLCCMAPRMRGIGRVLRQEPLNKFCQLIERK